MGKLARFQKRLRQAGQSVTLYPYSADPSGDYVDPWSGWSDPEDPDYPDTVPDTTYGDAQSIKAFVQPLTTQDGGTVFARNVHGQDEPVQRVAHVAGDQAVTLRDKIVYDSLAHSIVRIEVFRDGDTAVLKAVYLRQKPQ